MIIDNSSLNPLCRCSYPWILLWPWPTMEHPSSSIVHSHRYDALSNNVVLCVMFKFHISMKRTPWVASMWRVEWRRFIEMLQWEYQSQTFHYLQPTRVDLYATDWLLVFWYRCLLPRLWWKESFKRRVMTVNNLLRETIGQHDSPLCGVKKWGMAITIYKHSRLCHQNYVRFCSFDLFVMPYFCATTSLSWQGAFLKWERKIG